MCTEKTSDSPLTSHPDKPILGSIVKGGTMWQCGTAQFRTVDAYCIAFGTALLVEP